MAAGGGRRRGRYGRMGGGMGHWLLLSMLLGGQAIILLEVHRQIRIGAVADFDERCGVGRRIARAKLGNHRIDVRPVDHAVSIELGAPIYSTDNDFRRFKGIEHVNPLA